MKIKMYADGANLKDIERLNANPAVSGFTTNPTLMYKAGITDYIGFAKQAVGLVSPKPISLEVFSDSLAEMRAQALKLKDLGPGVYVKIPVTNTKGESTAALVKDLSASGLQVNVTAIFTRSQVEQVVAALDGGAPSVVSVFAGRIADAGVDPVPLMADFALEIKRHSGMELLWASPREILNVIQAENTGCHIITMTPDLFGKLQNLGKPLEEFSLETVRMFYDDAKASGFTL
jgi:transaldolase